MNYYKGIKNGRFKAFSQSSVITNRTSINDQGLASNIVRVYPTPRIPQSRTVNRFYPVTSWGTQALTLVPSGDEPRLCYFYEVYILSDCF